MCLIFPYDVSDENSYYDTATRIVQRGVALVGVSESLRLAITITDDFDEEGTLGAVLATADPCVFLMKLRPRLFDDRIELITVIMHELVHVEQFMQGRLTVDDDNKVFWRGRYVNHHEVSYDDHPWEHEAYLRQGYLAKAFQSEAHKPIKTMIFNVITRMLF